MIPLLAPSVKTISSSAVAKGGEEELLSRPKGTEDNAHIHSVGRAAEREGIEAPHSLAQGLDRQETGVSGCLGHFSTKRCIIIYQVV